jgi:hypothetical protein
LAGNSFYLLSTATYGRVCATGNLRNGWRDPLSHQRLNLRTKLVDLWLRVSH